MKKSLLFLIILVVLTITWEQLNAQWTYDQVSFETPTSKIIIDTTSGNLWQIGAPSKLLFNSAHSGIKAIMTDSLNSYPPNNTSKFIYVIRNPYTQTCYTSMKFWHKYDMDTLVDIGIIEASYDGGNSWLLVSDTNEVSPMGSYFWWDNDYHALNGNYTHHELTISGKSDGWIQSKFNWEWWIPVKADTIIVPPDSLMIRFTFISDSIDTNKAGWMIDDILTTSAEWQMCTNTKEYPDNENLAVFPNPFSSQTTIRSKYLMKQSTITVFNSFGQIVTQIKNINGHEFTLSRNNLPSGLYFLQLTENNIRFETKRLIITN